MSNQKLQCERSLEDQAPYVLPRLLYSVEVLNLNKSEIKMLNHLPINLLRKIQLLPNRTALAAVHLLLGALPLEAELHKRHLSLLFSLINSDNQTLHQLVRRSIVFCEDQPSSFFSRAKTSLETYGLPTIKQYTTVPQSCSGRDRQNRP